MRKAVMILLALALVQAAAALGPAPITIEGMIRGADVSMIRISASGPDGRSMVYEDDTIVEAGTAGSYYMTTLTVEDGTGPWDLEIGYISSGEALREEAVQGVMPWERIELNLTSGGEGISTSRSSAVKRPSSLADDDRLVGAAIQIREGNLSFVRKQYNSTIEPPAPAQEEQPRQIVDLEVDRKTYVLLLLVTALIGLASIRFYLKGRK